MYPQREPSALWQRLGLTLIPGVFKLQSVSSTLHMSPAVGQAILQRIPFYIKSEHMMREWKEPTLPQQVISGLAELLSS